MWWPGVHRSLLEVDVDDFELLDEHGLVLHRVNGRDRLRSRFRVHESGFRFSVFGFRVSEFVFLVPDEPPRRLTPTASCMYSSARADSCGFRVSSFRF